MTHRAVALISILGCTVLLHSLPGWGVFRASASANPHSIALQSASQEVVRARAGPCAPRAASRIVPPPDTPGAAPRRLRELERFAVAPERTRSLAWVACRRNEASATADRSVSRPALRWSLAEQASRSLRRLARGACAYLAKFVADLLWAAPKG